jgi:hypothetical protein
MSRSTLGVFEDQLIYFSQHVYKTGDITDDFGGVKSGWHNLDNFEWTSKVMYRVDTLARD